MNTYTVAISYKTLFKTKDIKEGGSFRGVVANVMDSDIVVSKFELQSR